MLPITNLQYSIYIYVHYLGNVSLVEHHYQIGILDRGQPMGDHKCCAIFDRSIEGFLDFRFAGGVQGTIYGIKGTYVR